MLVLFPGKLFSELQISGFEKFIFPFSQADPKIQKSKSVNINSIGIER
jgi:hypothetical protein